MIVVDLELVCDGVDGKPFTCGEPSVFGSKPRSLRREAAGLGWKRRRRGGKMVDLCPVCGAS